MSNRYICRGKRKDNKEWIYGGIYYQKKDEMKDEAVYIITGSLSDIACAVEVIPETVGQCTTLTDKNGKLIFTGDILHVKTGGGWTCPIGTDIYYEVFFTEFNEQCDECTEYIGFMAKDIDDDECSIQYLVCAYGAEVVGNVYDNPELLEVKR